MSSDLLNTSDQMVIYARLLDIKIEISDDPIPNPGYISSKIRECHRYIEEVEGYSIRLTRATSVLQQALNNAQAAYRSKLDNLLATDEDIKSMMNTSIKDREALANQRLKPEQEKIREYENTLSSLDNLSKAVNLKLKNLNRVNADVRNHARLMESQVKLHALPKTDPVVSRLAEELNKSHIGEDSFKNFTSTVEHSEVVDPTAPIDIDNLLKNQQVSTTDNLSLLKEMIDPTPANIDPEIPSTPGEMEPEIESVEPEEESEDSEIDKLKDDEPYWNPEESTENLDPEPTVDLDQMANIPTKNNAEQGGVPAEAVPNIQEPPSTQTSMSPKIIDLDDFLDKIG